MFGHQDNKSSHDDSNDIPDESIHGVLNDDQAGGQDTGSQLATVADPDTPSIGADNPAWQHPGQPIAAPGKPAKDVISPVGGYPRSTNDQLASGASNAGPPPIPAPKPEPVLDSSATHELIDIKQHALEELEPLIDQLDQKPDEKFRTIMMMIQASDDQALVAKAYEAAHSIEDEKVRAQALLDIVNEINYFTAQPPAPN